MPCVVAVTPLEIIIRARISATGAIPLSEYMGLCLAHPEHGYYMTRDPFGANGDFTTAPEISQMFGEMIGAWVIDAWEKMGAPQPFILQEVGPGRGTLMTDILRVTRAVPQFHENLSVHLVEMSAPLKEKQRVSLSGKTSAPVSWHADVSSVPSDAPMIIIGNEFLDALPVDQLVRRDDEWFMRCVDVHDGALCISVRGALPELIALIPPRLMSYGEGDVVEVSSILNDYLKQTFLTLEKQTGIALFIDYGYRHSDTGDSVQAVYKHASVSILFEPGNADITAHVNFENIKNIAISLGLTVHGAVTQGEFLTRLGIHHRADTLKSNATPKQRADIDAALHRLTAPDQMGDLFKVIAVSSNPNLTLARFA
jgi:NADH dehydrogenase [ubiquinone] 1 alpha subcomplex assembly factor 7